MKQQLHIDTLYVEVTRNCNSRCKHCKRGTAQNIDMSDDVIRQTFNNIKSIRMLVFTGGEPTLNVKAIKNILELCKSKGIKVLDFRLTTNGKQITHEFLNVMLEWYLYVRKTGGGSGSGIFISNDTWHGDPSESASTYLESLNFYKGPKETPPLIREGLSYDTEQNAYNPHDYMGAFVNGETPEIAIYVDKNDKVSMINVIKPAVYVAANGIVKLGHDDSYNNLTNYVGHLVHTNAHTRYTHAMYNIMYNLSRLVNDPALKDYHGKIRERLFSNPEEDDTKYRLELKSGKFIQARRNLSEPWLTIKNRDFVYMNYGYENGEDPRPLLSMIINRDVKNELTNVFAMLTLELGEEPADGKTTEPDMPALPGIGSIWKDEPGVREKLEREIYGSEKIQREIQELTDKIGYPAMLGMSKNDVKTYLLQNGYADSDENVNITKQAFYETNVKSSIQEFKDRVLEQILESNKDQLTNLETTDQEE